MPPALSTPTIAAPAAPQANPLDVKPGESILDYEARLGSTPGAAGSGMGFGTPQPIAPALVTKSLGGAPASGAAPASGGSPDTSSIDALAKSLGYDSYNDAVTKLTAPSDDTTSFYNSAYSAAGLDALNYSIVQKQNDLNTATGNINDNPWLDEASRVGRVKNLTTLAEGDIKNLQGEYSTKLKGVQDLVNQHAKDMSATDASNKAKLSFLEAQAKAIAAQQKTTNAAPKTIKGANGATFSWDPTTGQFKQILPPKAATPSGAGKPTADAISKITGEIQNIVTQGQANGQKDSFISPNDWANALAEWTAAGYSTTSFVTNFKGYANTKDPTNHYEGLN